MTRAETEAARAVIAGATSGTWRVAPCTDPGEWRVVTGRDSIVCCTGGYPTGEPDAHFIAAARTGWPAALARCVELEAEAERLRVMVKEAHRIDLSPEGRATYDNLRDRYFGEHRAEVERLRGLLKEACDLARQFDVNGAQPGEHEQLAAIVRAAKETP